MTQNYVINEYFEWLSDLVCKDRYSSQISYRKLLMRLHDIEFRYSLPMDQNRASDGINLRYRFAYRHSDIANAESYLHGPCSVLEMMVALSMRCEEDIMDDGEIGDRTSQWFWTMIRNLGLGTMTDSKFDRNLVDSAVARFLDRDYEPDGRGGLFQVKNCKYDMRSIEIWHQLNEYLNSIT